MCFLISQSTKGMECPIAAFYPGTVDTDRLVPEKDTATGMETMVDDHQCLLL